MNWGGITLSVNRLLFVRAGLALAALVLGGLAPMALSVPAAYAAAPLACVNTFYSVSDDTGPPGILSAINTTTQTSSTVPVAGGLIGDNALAVSQGGLFTYTFRLATVEIIVHNVVTGTVQAFPSGIAPGTNVMRGAINPLNGLYYMADNTTPGVSNVWVFNPATNTMIGQVGTLSPDVAPTAESGDFVFDTAGNLYVVVGERVYRADIPAPTTAGNVTIPLTTLAVMPAGTVQSDGIAFGSDGILYLNNMAQPTSTIIKIDPSSGAILSTFTVPAAFITDLGSCASPNTLSVSKNIQGRAAPTDQFGMSITGSGVTFGNTATTAGAGNGVQPEVAGPVLTLPNNSYSINQASAGTTDLGNYVTTWVCTDVNTGTVVASGTGNTGTFTYPTPPGPQGRNVQCVFTDVAIPTDFKSVNPPSTTSVVAGEELTYTVAFAGTSAGGSVNRVDDITRTLDDAIIVSPPASSDPGLTVTDGSNGLIAITGTLPPDQTVTVTYTVKVKPDGERGDNVLDNYLVNPGEPLPDSCLPDNNKCTTNPVVTTLVAAGFNEQLPTLIGASVITLLGALLVVASHRPRRRACV